MYLPPKEEDIICNSVSDFEINLFLLILYFYIQKLIKMKRLKSENLEYHFSTKKKPLKNIENC